MPEEKEEVIIGEPCGEVRPQTWRSPVKPSAAEIADHDLTHCPYRNWCSVCVEAMGREDPHPRQGPKEKSEVPEVGMDYDKYGEEEKVGTQITVLVVKDSETGMIKAHVVDVKGPKDEWVIKKVCKDIEGFGHSEIMLKTDGEPALVAVQTKIIARREATTVPENPPAYDPKANGCIEKGVQDVNARLRTIKVALEARFGVAMSIKLPIFEWALEHAAFVHNRFQVGHDGLTPYRRSTGKVWRQRIVEFGEQVHGKLAARRAATKNKTRTVHKNKMSSRWIKGTWVGMVDRSHESILITHQGKAVRVRTVKRRPLQERWCLETVTKITATPRRPVPGKEDEELKSAKWAKTWRLEKQPKQPRQLKI